MIPKKERASSFVVNKAFQGGRRAQSPTIDLVYVKSKNTIKPIFAVSVSKKAVKNSVDMHKTRRRIYDAIPKSLITEPQTYVFMVKKPIKELPTIELKECLRQLITKVNGL